MALLETKVKLKLTSYKKDILPNDRETACFKGETAFITVCYGDNSKQSWKQLRDSISDCQPSINSSWIVLGNFNAVTWGNEKCGGLKPNMCSMQSFNDSIDRCGLDKLPLSRPSFSWSNSSSGANHIESKLDRALVNSDLLHSANRYLESMLNSGLSNHSPILITSGYSSSVKAPFCCMCQTRRVFQRS